MTTPKAPARADVPTSPVILNVDDRPATLYARDRVLRLHGFTVENAETIKSALDAARRIRPHAILLDIHLPDGDGRELCQRLKADVELAHIPVVLISATLGGHANLLEGLIWGAADAYLEEPVEAEAIVSTLWKVIRTAA